MKELNKDYKLRDRIIFGDYDESQYAGGIRHFIISRHKAKTLLELGFAYEHSRQNYSPMYADFLIYTEDYEFKIDFEGYAISPEREDYKVVIDGIRACIPYNDCDAVATFVELFRNADEFSFEFDGIGNYQLRAWWD